MTITKKANLEDYDALRETLQEITSRLDRAETDRLKLINERVKLTKEVSELRAEVAALELELSNIRSERDKLISERDHLRTQLEKAKQATKSFAVKAGATSVRANLKSA